MAFTSGLDIWALTVITGQVINGALKEIQVMLK